MLSTAIAGSSEMDIDTSGSPPTDNGASEPHDDEVTKRDMAVDESNP
jgi:hypothetical protein